MKIEIRETKTPGIVQVTTIDERWYKRLEDGVMFDSVTWIVQSYPKGIAYMKWLASHGWDEAEALKKEAGERGSKIHHAVEALIKTGQISIEDEFTDSDGKPSQLTADEIRAVLSFKDWWGTLKDVEVLETETAHFNDDFLYAGTVDMRLKVGEETWIVDLKTGSYIWPSHELQLSAYKHFPGFENDKIFILQIGYNKTKKGYKLTEIEDKFQLFLNTQQIHNAETATVQPKTYEFPIIITLNEAKNGTHNQETDRKS